jgi:hypothetical protein
VEGGGPLRGKRRLLREKQPIFVGALVAGVDRYVKVRKLLHFRNPREGPSAATEAHECSKRAVQIPQLPPR